VGVGSAVAGAAPDRMAFFAGATEAVANCGWVQENGPENEAWKIAMLAEIDAATEPAAVIASSTSALSMSVMQSKCMHPQRCVTAHPFNPPHLVPLVELVGGKATAPQALDVAADF